MTNFIPIFPLGLVLYPGETLHLHIFEPRYIQLIQYCLTNKKPFGIPTVINNELQEMGTLAVITEISKTYENGEMDIKVTGTEVFRVLELIKELPEKLYSGAIVSYPENKMTGDKNMIQKLLLSIRQLHTLLKVEKIFSKTDNDICSYDIAHHAGMSISEEYELLQLLHELQRAEYLKQHLKKVLQVLKEMESLKSRIQLNGHFKELPGIKF
ncbi:MAG: LON peptidase substrate-binding domain-containing protein [Ferruginibacter sp.]